MDKGPISAVAKKCHILSIEQGLLLLKESLKIKDIKISRHLHSLILINGLDSQPMFLEQLIRMFGLCESLLEANLVFATVSKPSLGCWHSIISAHATLCNIDRHRAVVLYHIMQKDDGLIPSRPLLLLVIKTCAILRAYNDGVAIYDRIVGDDKLINDVFVGSALIDMYAKCGHLNRANEVFDKMQNRNIVAWNALLTGYVEQGQNLSALRLFERMDTDTNGIVPDAITFSSILKACGNLVDDFQGQLIHHQILKTGHDSNMYIATSLISMYAKCMRLQDACCTFKMITNQSLAAWNALLAGYVQHGDTHAALQLYVDMVMKGLKPDKLTFSSVLKGCGDIRDLNQGHLIHDKIIKSNIDLDNIVLNSLIDMYAKCGALSEARKIFDGIKMRDSISYGGLIAGYVQHQQYSTAIELFGCMKMENVRAESPVFPCMLKACENSGTLEFGMHLHDQILRNNFAFDLSTAHALLEMYAKFGSLTEAQVVFRSLPNPECDSWNALIKGYVLHGQETLALTLYEEMKQKDVKLNNVTVSCVLKACGNAKLLDYGKMIHEKIADWGFESDVIVGNTLTDMYCRCGDVETAREVFDSLSYHTLVSWGAMIGGYTENGYHTLALELFDEMLKQGLFPDKDLILYALKACGGLQALERGELVHDQIVLMALELDVIIANVLIEMYCKCGKLDESLNLFKNLKTKDDVSWGTLVSGLALHGNFNLVKKHFEEMQMVQMMPNPRAFTSMLAACSHSGLENEGFWFFENLRDVFGLVTSIAHYNCIVHLLASQGHTNDAKEFLNTMPLAPNITGWQSFLAGCKAHGNIDHGRYGFSQFTND